MALPSWINSNGKSIILIVGVACATELAWRLYKKYSNSNKKNQNSIHANRPISEVLFFAEQAAFCRSHVTSTAPCTIASCPVINLNKIVSYISSATRSLDVCVYFLTCQTIVKAILDLHRKDIIIRIITDDENSSNEASQILNLRKAGIKVRSRRSTYLMHHKFVIIDRKVLITGSANWTVQAFFGNCENIIVTNQSEIVNPFNNEFEKLWLRFNGEFNTDIQNGINI